jgi:hypothetical protein
MITRQQGSGWLIGTARGNGYAAVGQTRQNLMQYFLTGGINANHRFRIQHKPVDGGGGLHDQFFYLKTPHFLFMLPAAPGWLIPGSTPTPAPTLPALPGWLIPGSPAFNVPGSATTIALVIMIVSMKSAADASRLNR